MKIKISLIKKNMIGLFLVLCILFNSSYAYSLVSDTISLISLFLLFFGCAIYSFFYKSTLKRIQIFSTPLFMLSIFVFLLMFIHFDIKSWGAYFHIILVLLVSIYLANNINFNIFVDYTVKIMTIMTCVSIIAWLYVNMFGKTLPLPIINGASNGYYSSYYSAGIMYMNTYFTQKIMGAFWEPGIYAGVCILTLILMEEIGYTKKHSIIYVLILILGILLSFSTTGYFCLALYFIYILINKVKKIRIIVIITLLLLILTIISVCFLPNIILYLSTVFPSVFGKMTYLNASLLTRISGPLLDLNIMTNNIFIGVGMSQYNGLWSDLAKLMSVESRTSTITFYLANFGLLGGLYFLQILKILIDKSRNMISNLIMFVIIVIIVSTEPNYFNIFTTICILYLSDKNIRKGEKLC